MLEDFVYLFLLL